MSAHRSYKHVVDGLLRISQEGTYINLMFSCLPVELYDLSLYIFPEGVRTLWNGSSMVVARAVLMTLSQV